MLQNISNATNEPNASNEASASNESNKSNASNDTNVDCTFDITKEDDGSPETTAIGLILQYYLRHYLEWQAFDDLLLLINTIRNERNQFQYLHTCSKNFCQKQNNPFFTSTVKDVI